MIKIIALFFIALFIPEAVLAADDAQRFLYFWPHPGDLSVVYLSNIFGTMGGNTLYGDGSQILGKMFGVFNAAVLTIGGCVLVYSLGVTTLNTAAEGEFMGKKFNTLWLPVRTCAGCILLIPQTTGYNLAQILVMTVVLWGVGAANKVWDAALDYIVAGGILVAPNMPDFDASYDKVIVAERILESQVCMYGLYKTLETSRQRSAFTSACKPTDPNPPFYCKPVPNFLLEVSFPLEPERDGYARTHFPDFTSGEYASINGICGDVKWQFFTDQEIKALRAHYKSLGFNDDADYEAALQTVVTSRSLAVQQMYLSLMPVAIAIYDNQYKQSEHYQTLPLGVLAANNTRWVSPSNSLPALLRGQELKGAVAGYNAIMRPALALMCNVVGCMYDEGGSKEYSSDYAAGAQQALKDNGWVGRDLVGYEHHQISYEEAYQAQYEAQREKERSASRKTFTESFKFVQEAKDQGWIMAGSYFFNLINTNMLAQNALGDVMNEENTVEASTGYSTNLAAHPGMQMLINRKILNEKELERIGNLIHKSSFQSSQYRGPDVDNTVRGYADNAKQLSRATDGSETPTFAMPELADYEIKISKLPEMEFEEKGIFGLISGISEFAYNKVVRTLANSFIYLFNQMIKPILMSVFAPLFIVFAEIFNQLLKDTIDSGAHPIVVLSIAGNHLVELALDRIFFASAGFAQLAATRVVGIVIVMMMVFVPVLLLWIGIVGSLGYMMAYYVPLLPFMIFTFGAIAWLIGVIEAMVAAPLVGVGVMHPEGHDAFGKGDRAIMLLLSLFLRPSMMIIGFVAAIILSQVGMWIVGMGFDRSIAGGYVNLTNMAGALGFLFVGVIYMSMMVTIVQRSFSLIYHIPDKVLRWVGGEHETIGGEIAGTMSQELKQQAGESAAGGQHVSAGMSELIRGGTGSSDKKDKGKSNGQSEKKEGEGGAEGGDGKDG